MLRFFGQRYKEYKDNVGVSYSHPLNVGFSIISLCLFSPATNPSFQFSPPFPSHYSLIQVGIPGITGYYITEQHAAFLLHAKDDQDNAEQEKEEDEKVEYVEKNKDL